MPESFLASLVKETAVVTAMTLHEATPTYFMKVGFYPFLLTGTQIALW